MHYIYIYIYIYIYVLFAGLLTSQVWVTELSYHMVNAKYTYKIITILFALLISSTLILLFNRKFYIEFIFIYNM